MITLSDVLRYIIGDVGIGEGIEPEETRTSTATPARASVPAKEEISEVAVPQPSKGNPAEGTEAPAGALS